MENAAEALKMAGALLIFVLALSITIVSFGQARQTVDLILEYKDRETMYIDGNLYYKTTGTERTVGLETIIPTIYRAYLENYKIVFEGLEKPFYRIKNIDKYSLDLETYVNTDYENVALADDEQKAEFLCGILYGKFSNYDKKFEEKFNITVSTPNIEPLYDQLVKAINEGKIIKEKLGVYYQDDNEDVPDVNKTEKRIITYVIGNV